jgi:hypothetical protein
MKPDLTQHWRAYNPTVHLCGADLGGKDLIVTIDRIELEKVGDEGQNKPILYFKEQVVAGKNKGMICGSRVSTTIAKVVGSPILADWIGKQIQIFGINERNFGQEKDVVRVRPVAPKVAELPVLEIGSPKFAKVVDRVMSGEATVETARQHFTISAEVEQAIGLEIDARKAEQNA